MDYPPGLTERKEECTLDWGLKWTVYVVDSCLGLVSFVVVEIIEYP